MVSSFVSAIPVSPFILTAYLTITASNQPQRLGLPVTVPNSKPFSLIASPNSSFSSVGNGPLPRFTLLLCRSLPPSLSESD